MTPQEKNVFSKLFTKTELGKHEIELALTDDFKTIFDKSNNEQESIGQNLIKALSKAETDYKQNLQNLQNAKKIGDDLSSKAKDDFPFRFRYILLSVAFTFSLDSR